MAISEDVQKILERPDSGEIAFDLIKKGLHSYYWGWTDEDAEALINAVIKERCLRTIAEGLREIPYETAQEAYEAFLAKVRKRR